MRNKEISREAIEAAEQLQDCYTQWRGYTNVDREAAKKIVQSAINQSTAAMAAEIKTLKEQLKKYGQGT